MILIANGSEVHLALASGKQLSKEVLGTRVVSLPSTNLFAQQTTAYRDALLSPGVPLVAIEAGSPCAWQPYVGPQILFIGVNTYGSSAPGLIVMEHYGFTVENVCDHVRAIILKRA